MAMTIDNTTVPAALTRDILGSAISVHRELGPGLLESTYRLCLLKQLEADGMRARREVEIPIYYKHFTISSTYRADIVVDDKVLIELKAVEHLLPLHESQILTYLRHTRLEVGLLINFNVTRLMSGVKRFALSRPNPERFSPSATSAYSGPLRQPS
jgi:GxxExxY protein